MNIVKFNPLDTMAAMEEHMNRMFDDFNGTGFHREGAWTPTVDLLEEDNRYLILADLPGMAREDIEIDLDAGTLTLKGVRKGLDESEKEKYYRRERARGCFARRFGMPATVDPDSVKASFKDGVLTIEIPKPEAAKTRKVAIN
jgi:HSP20 family protein